MQRWQKVGDDMPHSLRVKLKNLQRKGELTDKDIDRIFKALEQQDRIIQILDDYDLEAWEILERIKVVVRV